MKHMNNAVRSLDKKLRKEFDVCVLDYIPSSLENDPIYVLQFPKGNVVNRMSNYDLPPFYVPRGNLV